MTLPRSPSRSGIPHKMMTCKVCGLPGERCECAYGPHDGTQISPEEMQLTPEEVTKLAAEHRRKGQIASEQADMLKLELQRRLKKGN